MLLKMESSSNARLDADALKIIAASHHDPFCILGRHSYGKQFKVKLYLTYAESVCFAESGQNIPRLIGTDFFEYVAQPNELPTHYQLVWIDKDEGKHLN